MTADSDRFENMQYRPCGISGLKLPAISLGCWFHFGDDDEVDISKLIFGAFDLGITHIDLANIYGPPPGAAERRAGPVIAQLPRDDVVVSTKGGLTMRPGPYGRGGTRKNLIESFDKSLARLGLDYVDIYYHHARDTATPIEETLGALDSIVTSGKALYAGISNYDGQSTKEVDDIRKDRGFHPPVVNQVQYSMIYRKIEDDLLPVVRKTGIGVVAYSPLARGMLAGKPVDAVFGDRAKDLGDKIDSLKKTVEGVEKVAAERGQSPGQMALAWTLRDPAVTTALIGASRLEQIEENVGALTNLEFATDELELIDAAYAAGAGTIDWGS
ncbi:MAG: aldo/keto reductase [Actinobacteria bacterium]|nr:aldo/keto reductase [Actinomycetota bacterium]